MRLETLFGLSLLVTFRKNLIGSVLFKIKKNNALRRIAVGSVCNYNFKIFFFCYFAFFSIGVHAWNLVFIYPHVWRFKLLFEMYCFYRKKSILLLVSVFILLKEVPLRSNVV
jgi:hypothetical protein